jgi:hypothetical protein
MRIRLRRAGAGGLAATLAALALPATAQAHGIVGRADLPVPVWLFSWAAAVVLILSFVALSVLWTRPQLQNQHRVRLFGVPRIVGPLASLFGLAVFGLVVYSGIDGAQVWSVNFSVTFIYVIFWVGLPLASAFFGDVFAVLSPWRTTARALRWLLGRLTRGRAARPPLRYPAWLGQWPAVAILLGFGFLELVYVERDSPLQLGWLSLGYFAVALVAMMLFGVEEVAERADGFGAYFQLLSRMSAFCTDEDGALCARRPLSGLTSMPILPGTVGMILTIIGTTTFDGFSNDVVWRKLEPHLQSIGEALGFGGTFAQELAGVIGLLGSVGLVAGVYWIGIRGVHSVSHRYSTAVLRDAFAHTLVPIAFAYVLAHYFSLLIWQGQAIGYLASDPLGNGANIFGTNGDQIDYTIISYAAIWYVQVAALVAGHVGGLTLAHDKALSIYRNSREAVRSQYWMLTVMVAFTCFGLWLLSAVGT